MLIIRKAQMKVLSQVPLRVFENEMLSYVRKNFPDRCDVLSDAPNRQMIALGIAKSKDYGFETRGDITDYITLMILFGSYFDEDPQLPWVAEILEDKAGFGPSAIIADLYAEAADYMERVFGDKGEFYKKAMEKARSQSFESLFENDISDSLQSIKSLFNDVYPEKYQTLTESNLERLVDIGRALSDRYGMGSGEGFRVYAFLMFMLGSHFDRDPLHAWAGEILQDRSIKEPHLKAWQLHEAAMAQVGRRLSAT